MGGGGGEATLAHQSNEALALKAAQTWETEQDARWLLGELFSEIGSRVGYQSAEFRAACGDAGIAPPYAKSLARVYQAWGDDERLPVSWTAHKDLAALARKLEVDKFALADAIVAWASKVERELADLEGRPPAVILYPHSRFIAAYRKAHLGVTPRRRITLPIPVDLIIAVQDYLRSCGGHDLADQLGKIRAAHATKDRLK